MGQGLDHLCGGSSKYRAGDELNCGEYPNIDAIFSEKDVCKDDSDDAPAHHSDKPGSFK
jgi:hypothetical protein